MIFDAVVTGAGVRISADDGTEAAWPVEWLRDNCRCDRCRIVQTDERRWQPWTELGPPMIDILDVAAGRLTIRWSTAHESTFTEADLTALVAASLRGSTAIRHWTAADDLVRFDHDQVVGDDDTRRTMFEAFVRDGAVVVTESPRVPGACLTLLDRLGVTVREIALGRIFDVVLDPNGFNVAYTAEAIPPHNDNAQCTHPPSGQILAMLTNDATGGETVVVDGWAVAEQLRRADPAAFAVLCRVPIGFRQYSIDTDGFTRAPLIVTDPRGRITHVRFSNQLRQPLPVDDPDLAEWYRAYRLLGRAVTDASNQVTFRLDAGDTLMVNGLRVLHGRTEFRPDGARHLQDVYFEVDDVVANLARLTGEATNAMMVS